MRNKPDNIIFIAKKGKTWHGPFNYYTQAIRKADVVLRYELAKTLNLAKEARKSKDISFCGTCNCYDVYQHKHKVKK